MQAFWLWSIKEALLDVARDYFYEHLATRYRLTHWAVMHPGSGRRRRLAYRAAGGAVLSSRRRRDPDRRPADQVMFMIPTMSVSGIVYPTETDFASCQVCHREGCPRRTAPFDEAVWRAVCAD